MTANEIEEMKLKYALLEELMLKIDDKRKLISNLQSCGKYDKYNHAYIKLEGNVVSNKPFTVGMSEQVTKAVVNVLKEELNVLEEELRKL